jgi:hypothetical protein
VLQLKCCLGIFNFLSHPRGFSLNIILDSFLILFIAYKVHFFSFLGRKLLVRSQAVQSPNCSDSFFFQAALSIVPLMMSSC